MTTLLSVRRLARLDADAVAPWLDHVGLPLVLAGAIVLMLAGVAS